MPRKWGSVARRGARSLSVPDDVSQGPGARARPDQYEAARQSARDGRPRERRRDQEEVWLREVVEDRPAPPRRRGAAAQSPPSTTREMDLPREVVDEIAGAVGREKGADLGRKMASAARAYQRDRYQEAFRITRPLVDLVPESAAVRELHGLVCYRLGRWRDAVRHLEAARARGGDDPSQIPVIMDCHRAMNQHRKVQALWEELRSLSPPADVLAEGRLVLAGDLADRNDLEGAIAVLASAGAARNMRHPAERHIRQWYVLADLYERAGDVPRARELFSRVASADPELADVKRRLEELGSPRRRT